MAKVYIVSHGERSEGEYIISVHQSHETAIIAAKNAMVLQTDNLNDWTQVKPNYWGCGIDYIVIREYDVKP